MKHRQATSPYPLDILLSLLKHPKLVPLVRYRTISVSSGIERWFVWFHGTFYSENITSVWWLSRWTTEFKHNVTGHIINRLKTLRQDATWKILASVNRLDIGVNQNARIQTGLTLQSLKETTCRHTACFNRERSEFCIYVFYMYLRVNSHYFSKH
jgi:hypothetical protein